MEASPVTTGLALLCAVLGVALWSVTSKSQGGPDGASTKRNQPTSKSKKKKSNHKSTSPKQEGVESSAQSVKESAEKERAPTNEKRVNKEKGKKSTVTTAANKVDTANGLEMVPQQDESLELSLAKKALSLHDLAHTNGSATPPSLVPSQVIASEPVPAGENETKKRKAKTKNGAAKTNDERRAEIDSHRSAGERDLGADMLDRDMERECCVPSASNVMRKLLIHSVMQPRLRIPAWRPSRLPSLTRRQGQCLPRMAGRALAAS